jgi:antitoxin (DNA-binding transcriptional repressor) of toxin-antitoxin stability system
MAEPRTPIDITNMPDLLRIVEEVRAGQGAQVLRRDGEDVAMVVPLPRRRKSRLKKPTAADLAAFRSAAGGWADLDTDTLIENIYRARREGTRPDPRP